MLRLTTLCRWPEGGGRPKESKRELTAKGRRAYHAAAGDEAAKEALITSALNKHEKAELNTLLRRLMIEFERRETA